MLQAAARQIAAIRVPVDRLVAFAVVASFFWLLLQDHIHPVVVQILELYLAL